jgi:hypothetical protein
VTEEPQDWQAPILTSLWEALIRVLPDGWDSAVLVLETTAGGFGTGLSHSILNEDGQPGLAFPNEDLFLATRRLELGFHQQGLPWRRAIARVWFDGENWRGTINYEYEHGHDPSERRPGTGGDRIDMVR